MSPPPPPRPPAPSRVVLSGLEFHGRHGVYPEEARFGGRFVVDVELEWDFRELADHLPDAVNYEAVYRAVGQEVAGTRRQLIEVLAGEIARRLLREHPRVQRVTVRVHKPHAPLPGIFRDICAELTLEQGAGESAPDRPANG
ncbi:MAG: dihydroneopterin aldolase [Deinococcus sp.]